MDSGQDSTSNQRASLSFEWTARAALKALRPHRFPLWVLGILVTDTCYIHTPYVTSHILVNRYREISLMTRPEIAHIGL